jgi:serine/threonine protein kinase
MTWKPEDGEAKRTLGPYELLKQVGAGGMGVVFQARDTERNTLVALKTLHKLEPVMLLWLKNEFRGMANLQHPNLVTLYEMRQADDVWFFTMEYVEGESLARLLHRAATSVPSPAARSNGDPALASANTVTSAPGAQVTPVDATMTSVRATTGSSSFSEETVTAGLLASAAAAPSGSAGTREPGQAAATPLLEPERLRHIFRELAKGISALHEAGKLHCDIKPGNVMVDPQGRVVLLDFGLVAERAPQETTRSLGLSGTPAYMAPEQFQGLPATEASDWYAMGVMLYEALTGRRPFLPGAPLNTRVQQDAPPLPPSPAIPEDLRELCMALLQRNPAARPTGREVMERLSGNAEAPAAKAPPSEPVAPEYTFLGREEQLARLREAYETMRGGRGVTVHIHGPSGMGKSALLQHFLEDVRRRESVLLLRGRCHERESVPYKAFDVLVDALTRYLLARPPHEREALLPEHIGELSRVFPVLRQLPGLSALPELPVEAPDRSELRLRAFRAFKELLARLARTAPLIVHLDDLQWGDADSLVLLNELVSPPDAPAMLLVCGFRSEGAEAAALLAEHRRMRDFLGERIDIREVELGPLSEADAVRLATALLGTEAGESRALAIARESQGNPFFVEELVRHALASTSEPSAQPPAAVTLERVIISRVGRLPDPARRLLETVAVAGRRIAQGMASRAADVESNLHGLWMLLRTGSMVRTGGARDADPVECYHDRIRETVHAQLPADALKVHHRRLAELLEKAGAADAEELALHYRKADVRDKALRYLKLAGDRAADALAFGHAAELYGYALECDPEDRALKVKRADALVNAGRCAEAAPLYLEASRGAPEDESFSLRRRACEQFLASGHIDEALDLLRPLMAEVGLPYHPTAARALMGMLGRSMQLSLRGTRFQERPESQIPPKLLKVADLALAAGKGVGSVDGVRGGYYSLRSVQMALEAGEPHRVARGLAYLSMISFARGRDADLARAHRQLAEAEAIAQRLGEPRLLGFNRLMAGGGEVTVGRWRPADRLFEEGLRLLEEKCIGVSWEIGFARVNRACMLYHLGEFGLLNLLGSQWLRHAEEVGDLYGGVWQRIYNAPGLMAAGEAEGAERLLREASELLSRHTRDFTFLRYVWAIVGCEVDLYRGEPGRARERLEEVWKKAEAAYLLRIPLGRLQALHTRALTTLALATREPARKEELWSLAERDAVQLGKLGKMYAAPSAALVRAAVAHGRGQRERTLAELDAAISGYEACDMRVRADCARRRKGELLGGEEGHALIESAHASLRERGVRDAARLTNAYAPGFAPGPASSTPG